MPDYYLPGGGAGIGGGAGMPGFLPPAVCMVAEFVPPEQPNRDGRQIAATSASKISLFIRWLPLWNEKRLFVLKYVSRDGTWPSLDN
jgi:hypothetical protein